MAKKLILHIGTEKTGTTSIQEFLLMNKDSLLKENILFPLTPCGSTKFPNHRKLATACFDYGHEDDSFVSLNLSKDDFRSWSSSILDEICAELKGSECDLHILSSEHFSSRLQSESEIQRLYSFLSKIYSEIEVVVYFRRQDQYVVSSYSTLLKSGGISSEILPSRIDGLGLDYNEMCEIWSRVFGRKSLNVRIFDRSKLRNSNVISDFMGILKQDLINFKLPEKESNPSLLPIAQEALINVNSLFKKGIVSDEDRQDFISFLEKNYGGSPRLPRRDYVLSWYEKFETSNSKFFTEYLGGGGFSDNFASYPEGWLSVDFSSEVMARMLFEFFKSIKSDIK